MSEIHVSKYLKDEVYTCPVGRLENLLLVVWIAAWREIRLRGEIENQHEHNTQIFSKNSWCSWQVACLHLQRDALTF